MQALRWWSAFLCIWLCGEGRAMPQRTRMPIPICLAALIDEHAPRWLRSPKILFVHDSDAEVDKIVDVLRGVGMQPIYRRVHTEAELTAALEEKWNLAITAQVLSQLSSLDAIKSLRRRRTLPVLVTSAVVEPEAEAAAAAMQAGASDFLRLDNASKLALAAARELKVANDRRRRRRLMRERMTAQDDLQRFFAMSHDVLIIADRDGRARRVNPAFLEIFGLTEEEALERKFEEAVHPQDLAVAQKRLTEAFQGKVVSGLEIRLRCKDGSYRPMVFSAKRGNSARGDEVIFVVGRDVTEQKRRDEQEVRSARMEALGQLAGGIAHDFNNLLTVVTGYSEILWMQFPEQSAERETVAQVLNAGNKAADLVRRINAFGRKVPGEKKPMKLEVVVADVLKLLRGPLPSTIELSSEVGHRLPPVMGDPTQIHQVVLNLATNASHAIQKRREVGKLSVSLKDVALATPLLSQDISIPAGRYVKLSVSDDGIGMPPWVQARIFEPYFTTKEISEGTGLGLSVVHGVMTDHQGYIVVNSVVGEGTTFDLYFPALAAAEAPLSSVQKLQAPMTARSGAGKTLLIVEDEAPVRAFTQLLLLPLGYEIEIAANGEEALAKWDANPGKYDAVITDLTMPKLTGIGLAAKLRERGSQVPIVLITGSKETTSPSAIAGVGIRHVLAKPFSRTDFLAAVEKALGLDEDAE